MSATKAEPPVESNAESIAEAESTLGAKAAKRGLRPGVIVTILLLAAVALLILWRK